MHKLLNRLFLYLTIRLESGHAVQITNNHSPKLHITSQAIFRLIKFLPNICACLSLMLCKLPSIYYVWLSGLIILVDMMFQSYKYRRTLQYSIASIQQLNLNVWHLQTNHATSIMAKVSVRYLSRWLWVLDFYPHSPYSWLPLHIRVVILPMRHATNDIRVHWLSLLTVRNRCR